MSIIDASFFVGEINIANTDETSVLALLQLYIDEYEPAYLKILLGDALYQQFIAGLAILPVDQEWTDLLNQLVVVNGTSKVSPIANYIYFYFIRRATYSSSGAGMTQPKYENATVIDSKIECSRAWNKMNKQSFVVYKFLKTNVAVYGALYYDLRFWDDNWIYYWFDWSYWWGILPFTMRRCVPEIFRPINALGI